jgi:TRAP-type C4-dicarboxylate transport system permease small subunit
MMACVRAVAAAFLPPPAARAGPGGNMRKGLEKTNVALCYLAAVILLLSTVLSVYNTIGRVMFMASFSWIEELCCYSAGFIMFIMCPFLEFNDRQLSIAFLEERFKNTGNLLGRKIIFYIRGIVTVFIFSLLARAGFSTFTRNLEINSKSPIMEWSYGVLYLILFVCVVLVIVFWAFHFFMKKWDDPVGGDVLEFD